MLPAEILKKVRRIEIRTNRLVNESLAGEYHSVFKGRGMEFSEVREYQFGDDIRNIDWNVTSRMGHPYVKKHVEERELTVILLVDFSASGDFGTQRQFKREIAAALKRCVAPLPPDDEIEVMFHPLSTLQSPFEESAIATTRISGSPLLTARMISDKPALAAGPSGVTYPTVVVVSASGIGRPTAQTKVAKASARRKLNNGPANATMILSSGLIGGNSVRPGFPSIASIGAIWGKRTNPPAGIQPRLNSTPLMTFFQIGLPNQTPNLST